MSSASSLILFLVAVSVASFFGAARSDDADEQLLRDINSYRASLNLSVLTENENADCLADEIANKFEGQPCTNSTGSNAILGSEGPIPDYPTLLSRCKLDISVTKDAAILPACVPGLVPSIVLTNFTKSQYNQQLNDSRYVGAGVASEGNWVVVVLSTATPQGNLSTVQGSGSGAAAAVRAPVASGLLFFAVYLFVTAMI
ncbi:unnamed protein product [Spirodela intermedia]|uniref:Uncharacterized GPI-anchored protein At5g19230-like domain-containing protein n=1 Tax=Spirodela intermedia TaxID=51605 RepID=A0A7I8KQ97_SPIIN|nr:unnamed protein product [Spirodela intermedia]